MTRDRIKHTIRKEVEKAGAINILNVWGVIVILFTLAIGGYKIWIWSSQVPSLSDKVDTIGIYLASNPHCDGFTSTQKKLITKDNWQKHLEEKIKGGEK